MRIRPSVLISIGLAVGVTAWIASGNMDALRGLAGLPPAPQGAGTAAPAAAEDPPAPAAELGTVQVVESAAQPYVVTLSIFGRTEASRALTVRAETSGTVEEVLVREGDRIDAGAAIARLALDDRLARRARAEALVAQREIEVNAARKLADRGFQSQTRLAEAEANLAEAKADLDAMRVDIANTRISAAFEGVIAARHVEPGDFVQPGTDLVHIVDLDPLVIAVDVSEREVGYVSVGTVAEIELVTGLLLDGVVSRIAPSANPTTRTFRVEIEVDNPDDAVRDGITANVRLPLKRLQAHRVSPALLTLDDGGTVGVKSVDEAGRVAFHPVEIVGDTAGGMWLAGLPSRLRLISVGQTFVSPGETVIAVPDTTLSRAGNAS